MWIWKCILRIAGLDGSSKGSHPLWPRRACESYPSPRHRGTGGEISRMSGKSRKLWHCNSAHWSICYSKCWVLIKILLVNPTSSCVLVNKKNLLKPCACKQHPLNLLKLDTKFHSYIPLLLIFQKQLYQSLIFSRRCQVLMTLLRNIHDVVISNV